MKRTREEILKEMEEVRKDIEIEKEIDPDSGALSFYGYQLFELQKELEELENLENI